MGYETNIKSVLGFGDSGLGYTAQAAPIDPLVSKTANLNGDFGQLDTAYGQTQTGLHSQQAFLEALQAQNGIQNQSNVYNQLAGVASGTGPNPALQQFQNATGQNVANQAALMAGQRGSAANVGLLARQAAMQGGNIQQQAAGQGAALQAQQQLAAMGAMGQLAGQQVGQLGQANQFYNQAAQSSQQNLLNAAGNYNNANVAMQSNMNSANARIATMQADNQSKALFGAVDAAAKGAAYFAKNSPTGGGNTNANTSAGGEPIPVGYHGGQVKRYAMGGNVEPTQLINSFPPAPIYSDPSGPQSMTGRLLLSSAPSNYTANDMSLYSTVSPEQGSSVFGGGGGGDNSASVAKAIAEGAVGGLNTRIGQQNKPMPTDPGNRRIGGGPDREDAYDPNSPGPSIDDGSDIGDPIDTTGGGGTVYAARGGLFKNYKNGTPNQIPGKAKVKGDSLKNDTVPAMLSPGEVVIPRHVMQSKDPVKNAAKFVQAILAKNGMSRK